MISQYLGDKGFNQSKLTLMDESNLKKSERNSEQTEVKRMKKAILGLD